LRRELEAVVRRRVRGNDAEDVVQAALADVLSAARVPESDEEFRRFVFAVTRNKVFDHFRKRVREVPEEEGLEPPAPEAPLSAQDLLRWAEQKLPDAEAEHTLEWMLREGDGEKLEHIARDVDLPAPRVRQRVSRLRRLLRERWAAELMLGLLGVGLLVPVAVHYYRLWQNRPPEIVELPRPEPLPTPEQRGRELRRSVFEQCERHEDVACLEGLDRAAALDPAGDSDARVVIARRAAARRLAPPAPPPTSSAPLRRPPRPASTESSLSTPMPTAAPGKQK
jgi:RNA polymerase sigma factor (sigma-70 family)